MDRLEEIEKLKRMIASLESDDNERRKLYEELKDLCANGNYAVGLHGTDEKSAKSILNSDLNFSGSSVLATITSLNDMTNESECEDNFWKYPHRGLSCNVVIASPKILTNSKGESIYIGFPPLTTTDAGNQYTQSSIFDTICARIGAIPNELIYGYYKVDKDNSDNIIFVKNPYHYSNLSQQEQDKFFDMMKEQIQKENLVSVSECVINGEVEKLERIKNFYGNSSDSDVKILETAINDFNSINNNKNKKRR